MKVYICNRNSCKRKNIVFFDKSGVKLHIKTNTDHKETDILLDEVSHDEYKRLRFLRAESRKTLRQVTIR